MTEVVACLATIPPRHKELKLVCKSLLPQVDRLFIYFNGYTEDMVPTWAQLMPNIHWTCSSTSGHGDLGDVGKFFFASREMREKYRIEGDVFTCDDDIVYPEWYVERTQTHLRMPPFARAILSYHGATLPSMCTNYHRQKRALPVKGTVRKLSRVHVAGTGCMSFSTSTFAPSLTLFEHTNMADIFVAKWAAENGVDLFVLPHYRGEFKILDIEDTIWRSTHSKDGSDMDRSAQINSIVSSLKWGRV